MCSWFSDEQKTESTQSTKIPANFQNLMNRTISFANQGLDTPFTAYQGDRIAGLSNNEQMGTALAAGNAGMYQDLINMAATNNADMQAKGGLPTGADIQSLINPYVNYVLGNSMNRLNEQGDINNTKIGSQAAMSGAFGSSRHGVLEGANLAELLKSTAELSSNTYSDAYDKGMGNWFKGQALRSGTINDALNIAGKGQAYNQGDIESLMNTGKTGRTVDQAEKDFGYSEFLRELADPYSKASFAGGIMAQYPRDLFTRNSETTQTSTPSILSSAIGLGTMAAGLMTGGAAGAAGMSAGSAALSSAPAFSTPAFSGGTISGNSTSGVQAGGNFSDDWWSKFSEGGKVRRYKKGGKVKGFAQGGALDNYYGSGTDQFGNAGGGANQADRGVVAALFGLGTLGMKDKNGGGFREPNEILYGDRTGVTTDMNGDPLAGASAPVPRQQIDWNAFRQRHHMGEFARPQPTMGNTFPNASAPNLPSNRPDLSSFVNALRMRLGNPGQQQVDPLNPGMPTPHVYKKGGKVKKNNALPIDESEIRPVVDSWTQGNYSRDPLNANTREEYLKYLIDNKQYAQRRLGRNKLGDLSNFSSETAADGNASQQEYMKQAMAYQQMIDKEMGPGARDSIPVMNNRSSWGMNNSSRDHDLADMQIGEILQSMPPAARKKYLDYIGENGTVNPSSAADTLSGESFPSDTYEGMGEAPDWAMARYMRWKEQAKDYKYGSKYAKGGKVTGFDYSTRDGYGQAKMGNFRRPTTNAPNRDYVDPLDSMLTEYDRDVKRGDLSQILAAIEIKKKQAALDYLNSNNFDADRNSRLRKGIADVGEVGTRLKDLKDKNGNPAILPPLPHRQALPPGDDMGGPLDSSAFSPTVEDYQEYDAKRERNRLIRDKMMQGINGFAKGGVVRPRPKPTDTVLTPKQEKSYQKWKAQYAPNDSGQDYDLRGAFLAGVRPGKNGHMPDTFKMPWHPTFSNESKYYDLDPLAAGHWDGENFIPPVNGGPYKNDFEQAPQGLRGAAYAQGGFVDGGKSFSRYGNLPFDPNEVYNVGPEIPDRQVDELPKRKNVDPRILALIESKMNPDEVYTLAAQKWESGASEYGKPNYQARPGFDENGKRLSTAFGIGQWTLKSWNDMAKKSKNKLPIVTEKDLDEGRFPSKEEQDRAWGIWQDTAKGELGARDNYLNRFAWHQLGITDFNKAINTMAQDPNKRVREVLGNKVAKNVSAWNPKTGKDETLHEYFGRLNSIYSDAYEWRRNQMGGDGRMADLNDVPADASVPLERRRPVYKSSPLEAQSYNDLFGKPKDTRRAPENFTLDPQQTMDLYRAMTPEDTSAHRKVKNGQTVVRNTTPNIPDKLLNDASDPLHVNALSDFMWGGQSFAGGGHVKGYAEGKTVLRDKNGKVIPESKSNDGYWDSVLHRLNAINDTPIFGKPRTLPWFEERKERVTLPLNQTSQNDPLASTDNYQGPEVGTGSLGLLGNPYGEDPVDNYWQHLSEMGSGASYGADTNNLLNAFEQGDGSGGLTNDINAAHAAEQDALSLELKKYIAGKLEDLKNTDENPTTDPLESVFGKYNKGLFRIGANILAARTGNAFSNIATGILASQDQEEAGAMKKIKDKNDRFKDLLNVRYLDAMTNQMSPQTRQAIAAETNATRLQIAKLKEQGAYARQQASFEENARKVGLKALLDKAMMGEKYTEEDRGKIREYMFDDTYPVNVDTSDIEETN